MPIAQTQKIEFLKPKTAGVWRLPRHNRPAEVCDVHLAGLGDRPGSTAGVFS
ncbi:hypothetical protein [Parathermosynechococcus lividus]|uniref:hypothetical protein n=1 Tax=Parathermosynechococcus lividus TaxID=33070 RepID=UPI0012FD0E19|nr:hypothetical protein [Thermostichus lividus]MCH9055307.1 hypothetical protein [Synechococcus sp. PCC 6716]